MVKLANFAAILFVSFIVFQASGHSVDAKERSQTLCAGCVIVFELMDQMIAHRGVPVEDFVNNQFCQLFPAEVKLACNLLIVGVYGPAIIDGIKNKKTGDVLCKELEFCTKPECSLIPARPFTTSSQSKALVASAILKTKMTIGNNHKILDWISDIIDKIKNKQPVLDMDGDNFSVMQSLRGSNWRGKDCDDFDENIYPGRRVDSSPNDKADFSCNGIYGASERGRSWQDELCRNSGQIGVAVLGDSAGAKFSIPATYMNASQIDKNTFKNLYDVLLNELDQPYVSAFTGFHPGTAEKPQNSIYKYLRERNLCNHRDYQNLATNGARSGSALRNSQSLSRNKETDHPLIVFLELIGNDVCSPHHTFDRMTKPEDFYKNIMEILNWLDTKLPNNSHVFILGLANGSVLYDKLWNETHPIGYEFHRVYDFLNCLNINPCWGWLNSNKTVRDTTTEKAMLLNKVYLKIMSETKGKFKNFDMLYYDYPAKELMDYWESIGGDPAELIEPIDGFHPAGRFHSLLAEWMWKKILRNKPHWVGHVNPNNNVIRLKFGDQGGH